MIRNHEDDEFVAVRVQDPRTQNEGSWNSYVDYKIFLHTNSKAFTAKTSCVRRRYSEFEWLRKKLQKNAGLVPVPDLPGKSFFSFNNEDFLEKRRRGLQVFLDKVVHTTVCLSDSQLHLFLQTQLPVGHIQDCVQGLTPYSVTDAILTYASSNRGLAQAQQEDSVRDPSLTISYESMESPAPHQPSLQPHPTIHPKPVPGADSDPLEDILELCEQRPDETRRGGDASIRISQRSDQLEAVVEGGASARVSFYLGEIQTDSESLGSAELSCVIQTPVEVHSPEGDDVFEDETAPPASEERRKSESVMCVGSEEVLTVEDDEQEAGGSHAASEDVKPGNETDSREETAPQSGTRQERQTVEGEPEEDGSDSHRAEAKNGDGEDSEEDSRSLPSSNDSIVRCSEEESLSGEAEEAMQVKSPPDGVRNGSEADGSGRAVFYMNGCNGDEADGQPCTTNGECPEPKAAAADGDLTENCDFSILGTSCQPGVDDGTFTNHQAPVSIPVGGSEESWNQSYPTKAAPPSLGQNHEALVSSPAEP
ncbi:sorting nexin-11 isoform X2 [Fundulus heteroclitus]|uniref:sorting nexin-11 isoform X2 n=1 Tax=Fundulus heteroclitus TaxID=8078 RepID=UPI00165BD0BA|nr:sorting nexin-11 isoform X2 [Fundulus heteroclitus]